MCFSLSKSVPSYCSEHDTAWTHLHLHASFYRLWVARVREDPRWVERVTGCLCTSSTSALHSSTVALLYVYTPYGTVWWVTQPQRHNDTAGGRRYWTYLLYFRRLGERSTVGYSTQYSLATSSNSKIVSTRVYMLAGGIGSAYTAVWPYAVLVLRTITVLLHLHIHIYTYTSTHTYTYIEYRSYRSIEVLKK